MQARFRNCSLVLIIAVTLLWQSYTFQAEALMGEVQLGHVKSFIEFAQFYCILKQSIHDLQPLLYLVQ